MKQNKNSKIQLPAKRPESQVATKSNSPIVKSNINSENPLNIAEKLQHFKNRDEVRKFLPDILGRVLARIWIDVEFRLEFSADPQKTLEFNGVYLPEDMTIEFLKPNSDRPRIVVYEQKPNSKFKLRVLYLQLVMMAGR
tara:strand:- start:494 stop:910 length:417 start_codon:yes stop_codon:yes gene_type:complete